MKLACRWLCIWLVIAPTVNAQNLLVNMSFDSLNFCCEKKAFCAPVGWFWFNENMRLLSMDARSAPYSIRLTCATADGKQYRQYIISPILCPLVKGAPYRISIYLKAAGIALDELGILFTGSFPLSTDILTDSIPQVKLRNKRGLLYQKKGWMEIVREFNATGTEKFIVIGNFKKDKDLYWKRLDKHALTADYLVDDVTLTPVNENNACDYTLFLDTIIHESRRHGFSKPCSDNGWLNLFPQLLDTAYLMTGITTGKTMILKNIFFDTDKAELLPASYPALDSLAQWLAQNPKREIRLTGHTDNTGDSSYNQWLSEQRAKAIAGYFNHKGISTGRITYEGKGASEPLDTNDTEEGRMKNRRVEFLIPE